jgi:hypothetical protein
MSTKPNADLPIKPKAADKPASPDKVSSREQQLSLDNTKLRAELDKRAKQSKKDAAKLNDTFQENELLQLQLMQAQEEMVECYQQLNQLKLNETRNANLDKDNVKLKNELDKISAEHAKLKAELEKLTKESKQASAKLEDHAQENELLHLQLMQAQEELTEFREQKGQFEELYTGYKARWDRLEKRMPAYVDFGALELVTFDNVSDIPSLTWRIKDYAQSMVAIPELEFTTLLHDGHPGIGLVKAGVATASFVPRLLTTSPEYLKNFLGCTTSDYKQISAIVPIFEQLEASNWQGFEFPANFDASFWRPSLKTLMAQLKALPPVLRYDDVVLKRELINPDYEHLWLEFRGLALGTSAWRKFELRLGAALVQPDGFSLYPKFEFPLIDGKTKPFDSWYAESYDDSGAKLELRFALDKQAVDTAVLAKLSEADRGLLLRLVNATPDALLRLDAKRTAIHRPWSTWVDFARGVVALLQASRAAPANASTNASTNAPNKALTSTPVPAVPLATKLLVSSANDQPAARGPAVSLAPSNAGASNGGMKVLSFHTKQVKAKAKTTTTASKAVHNNKKRKEA